MRGPSISYIVCYRKGDLPSPLLVVMVVIKGVLMLVWLVLGLYHGDSHSLRSQLGGWTPKGLK
jgi:hypothetical protein